MSIAGGGPCSTNRIAVAYRVGTRWITNQFRLSRAPEDSEGEEATRSDASLQKTPTTTNNPWLDAQVGEHCNSVVRTLEILFRQNSAFLSVALSELPNRHVESLCRTRNVKSASQL
jgi:hypothetical protein